MSIATDLQMLAHLCRVGAEKVLQAQFDLGPRPLDPNGAALWDQTNTRLGGQMNSLTLLVSKLSAAAVIAAMDAAAPEVAELGRVTALAQDRIRQIAQISDLLTKLADVLDLGLAVLAVAAAPSPATIAAMVTATSTLADAVGV